jgi:multidrug efflux pump subunit AcrB
VFDQSPFITQSIDDLTTEGGVGLLFAVVVILRAATREGHPDRVMVG